jgi:hypothetical protein
VGEGGEGEGEGGEGAVFPPIGLTNYRSITGKISRKFCPASVFLIRKVLLLNQVIL